MVFLSSDINITPLRTATACQQGKFTQPDLPAFLNSSRQILHSQDHEPTVTGAARVGARSPGEIKYIYISRLLSVEQVDGLVQPPQGEDIHSLRPKNTRRINMGDILTRSAKATESKK